MSCEVPIIATNVSSIPELVSDFGTLIEPKNENQLKRSIIKVMQNYDHFKDIAIKGRQHVIETFNWSKITSEYEKIIYETVDRFKKC